MRLPPELYRSFLNERSIYKNAPPPRSASANNPTLLVSWWCTGFALAIILVRVIGRYIRTERLFREDKIMALSLIPLLARMGLVHVILLYGTNNATIDGMSAENLRRRAIGSRLVLASRIMYAAFLWIAKFTVSEFLKRLTSQVWKKSYELGLQVIRYFLVVTFFAVVVATLSECQPFSHYWRVSNDPGPKCRQGAAQLITMGSSDIITDILLVCFPIPIVLKSTMPVKRKISLVLLFALSLILVAITLYRVVGVIQHEYEQQFRSLLASLEILAAAAVSNALVLGSFVRDRGTKKQRWRHGGSIGGQSSLQEARTTTPRRAMTQRNWGSDADLVGDLGISCAPELSEKLSSTPRPAPLALPSGKDAKNLTPTPLEGTTSANLIKIAVEDGKSSTDNGPVFEVPPAPASPSFFDVGGLLGENDPPATPKKNTIAAPQYRNFSRPTSPMQSVSITVPKSTHSRKGSDVFLEDVGALQSSTPHRPVPHERGISLADLLRESGPSEPQSRNPPPAERRESPPEIQDAGGLLSPFQRPSTSEQRGISLVDVLRETGPDGLRQPPSPPVRRIDTPPEMLDIGGLLSRDLGSSERPMSINDRANASGTETGQAMPSDTHQRPQPPKYDEQNMRFEDIGGLLR